MAGDENQQLVGVTGKASRRHLGAAVVNTGWAQHHESDKGHNKDDEEDPDLATPWGTIRSLINCFVSGGILGLAYQCVKTGSGTTLILLAVTAVLIYVTMMMLWDASVQAGTTGFMQTANKLFGKNIGKVTLVSLLVEQLGTIICYFNILRDTLPRVAQQNISGCIETDPGCNVPFWLQSWFIITLLTVFFIGPISCLSNPDVFSQISFVTWVHFGAFLVMMIVEAVAQTGNREGEVWPAEDGGPFRFGTGTFSTTAIIAFSMAAHSTLLALLYGTKLPKEDDAARKVIVMINGVSIVTVCAYYIVIAGCFYMAFGTTIMPNGLNSFPSDHIFSQIIRCTYTIEIGTSIPLFVYTFRRNTLIAMYNLSGSQEAINECEKEHRATMIMLTILILVVSALCGLFLNLDVILGFSGAVAATLNSFVLPAAMYYVAEKDGPAANSPLRKYAAPCIVVFGFVLGFIALIDNVRALCCYP